MNLTDTQFEFLQDVAKLIEFAKNEGYKITGGELYRTAEQQAIYFNEGKSKAKMSQHQKRLAIDLNVFKNGNLTYEKADIEPLGKFWESLNKKNRWGGNFTSLVDTPHFERIED
jgi:peptidoglycan L-alanyl-D-glutamate endopeptidase CwlK